MICAYHLVYRCDKQTIGVSMYCAEHLARQQRHEQKRLKWKKERAAPKEKDAKGA